MYSLRTIKTDFFGQLFTKNNIFNMCDKDKNTPFVKKFGMTWGQSAPIETINQYVIFFATLGLTKTPDECREYIDQQAQLKWTRPWNAIGDDRVSIDRTLKSEKTLDRLRRKLKTK